MLIQIFDVGRDKNNSLFFFFFQAEDGIRDAQESRGLGDVYKRQPAERVCLHCENARISTPVEPALFLDCDDCLYYNDWKTAKQLTASIEDYCTENLGLPAGKAYEFYKQYGTALRGLQAEEVPGFETEEYLATVHGRLSLEDDIHEDRELRQMLQRIDRSRVPVRVFTASSSQHATRCIRSLGVDDLLISEESPVIDVRAVGFRTKHDMESFEIAMTSALGEHGDPQRCILVDDSWSNLKSAKTAGWRTVLCGRVSRDGRNAEECEDADFRIDSIHGLPEVLPELFMH
eukprot:TRINITY_DN15312_c0_g1_i6.p1 TRINITY_DN15312_c0_g1~~TRINITY_DN15312_c0_g1_i6.p1  ORF type:complete len:289 (-),score=70.94 TRINITY_DN15312_c0_g1_i6:360-1226(-)